jgi:uncharacterized membrane protein YbhN (UPF0104 family)
LLILVMVATIALIPLFASMLDLEQSLTTWREMPVRTLLAALLLVIASSIARAGRLYHHFHAETAGRFSLCLRVTLHHNFFNNLLPLRTGEATFPLLLRQHFNIEITRGTAALLSFRTFDLSVLLVMGLFIMLSGFQLTNNLPLLVILLLATTLMVTLIPFLLRHILRSKPRLATQCALIRAGLPDSKASLFRLTIWTISIWSVKLIGYGFILQAFLLTTLPLSLLAALGGELGSGIPLYTPAAIGGFEGGVLAVLLPAGITSSAALTAAVNLHLFLLAATLISALLGLTLGKGSNVT